MPNQLDTPEWRAAEQHLAAIDPLDSARIEAWHRGQTKPPELASDKSISTLDSFTKPESMLGEALTGAGFASRIMVKVPFAESMSWGVTALGRMLTAYSIAEDKEKTSTYV